MQDWDLHLGLQHQDEIKVNQLKVLDEVQQKLYN